MTPVLKVLHPITRLIVGGAQENTMLSADWMGRDGRYQTAIVSGIQTGAEGSLIPEVERRQIPLHLMPELVREVNIRQDLKALGALYRLMRREKVDIVHTHSSKAGLLGRLAANWAGVPLIVHTVHGWSFHDQMSPRKRRFYAALEKVGAANGHAMVVVSPHDITKGVAQGIGTADSYTVIRSGVEMDRFGHPEQPPATMRALLGIPPGAPVVGSVMRLSAQKAPLDLVAAWQLVHQTHPQTWFVLVGDGPLRSEVEAALTAAGISAQTVVTGLRRDVPELMATFDIFALSSLWEGLPRVLPQAMATAIPIVCTAADGSAEAVQDGVNGFLVERGHPALLAARINELLANPARAREMGARGAAMAAPFSAQKMVADLDALYQKLWAAGGASRSKK